VSILPDIRFGWRILAKSPGFTLAAVVAIALGIGVNSMMFTIYNAVLFKTLPFENPRQIVHIHSRNLVEGWDRRGVLYEDFLEYRAQARSFEGLAAFMSYNGYTVSDERGAPHRIEGCLVTPNTFSLIGQRPLLGRDFRPDDGMPEANKVAILSYGLWQTRYGGDPSILGTAVTLSAESYTIVGIMPRDMEFPKRSTLWVPIVDTAENRDLWYLRSGFELIGRLPSAVLPLEAQTELRGIAGRIAASRSGPVAGIEPVVLPYVEWDVNPQQKLMGQTLMGAVSFVLLIACANVANLLLSRAVHRSRETAIRLALGASRGRIVRQLLIESVLLSMLGGAVGLGFALILVRLFVVAIQPFGIAHWVDWSMDARSFVYLLVICVMSGVLFGLAPALQISRTDVTGGLKETGRQATGGRRTRLLTHALVVAEISLTFVLMVGAGLLVRSLFTLQTVNLGFRTANVLTMTVPLDERKYPENADRVAFTDRLTERLASLPDLQSFTIASGIPASGAGRMYLHLADRVIANADGTPPRIATTAIGAGYFEALGLTMPRGREFTSADGAPGAEAVIVNQRFAAQYWPGEDPVGQKLRLGQGLWTSPWSTVVGVSPTIRQTSLRPDVDALVYLPFRQFPTFWFSIMARVRSPASAANVLREEVRKLDPDLPLLNMRTLDEYLDRLSGETRILSTLFSVFALIGLLLSAVGIYAVTAYATSQRTQEIGIRIALGAATGDVVWLVLWSGVRQLALALPIGMAFAIAVSRLLAGVLFEVTPMDLMTFVSIPVMLSAIVLAACLVPARRAARLSPVDALRTE
jgi:putative ABC transport system permease protein